MKNCYLSKLWAVAVACLAWASVANAQVKVTVNAPAGIAGDFQALAAAFSPALTGETADVVLADPVDGCTAPINSLAGSIALIDRGVCGFAIKAVTAQQAGAIGAIVCNNTPDFPHKAIVMGGTPTETITIPVVMVSYQTCQVIKAELANGAVNVTLSPDAIPQAAGEGCATAISITPGTYTVPEISGGLGAVFVSGILDNNSNAKWYSYIPTVNNIATVTSCGALVDSRLAIISGADCDNLTLIDVNDDCDPDNNEFASALSFLAVAGQQYFIYWDDRWDYNGFDFTLSEDTNLPTASVTFNVDMSNETVSGDGVRVAYGSSSNPTLSEVVLSDDDGDNVYSGSADITLLDTVGYVFVNGMVAAGNQENVPNECGVPSVFGFNFRPFIVGDPAGTALPTVCFGSCGPCIFTVDDCNDPLVIVADDAESYALGLVTGQAGADHFSGWPGGGVSFQVTDEQAESGAQSFKVDFGITGQDALLLFGDKTQDHYLIRWDMFVPSTKRAYFNIQLQAPTTAAGFWGMDAFFGDDGDGIGTLTLYEGGTAFSTDPFSYPNDEWFEVYIFVDLDNQEARMIVDETTVAQWQSSAGVTNGQAPITVNQLNSIDFYPRDANDSYYIDNIDYQQIPAASTGLYCYTAEDITPGTYTVPELSCFGGGYDLGGGDGAEKGYWFKYEATQNGMISISSCDGGADSRGWIFEGDCHGLSVIGINDDQCEIEVGGDAYASYREAIVEAGKTYYIMWDNAWEPTGFDFTLSFSTDEPVAGDFCQTAVPVTPGEYAVEEFTGNAAVAGPTIGTSTLSETAYAKSEWFSFTPDVNGMMTITSCNGAASDTRLWVYTGDCATFAGLTVVAQSDDDCLGGPGPSEVANVPVTAGTTYLIEWNNRFSDDAFLWELIFAPNTVDVTFQVDMALQAVDPGGVFLAGSFSDFNNLPMADGNGDGIYTATVAIPENTTVTYKFKNGPDGWESINTSIGPNCTTGDFSDRFYATTTADVTLPVVCFSYCVTCQQVDVDEVTLDKGLRVFPNPTKDIVNVQYEFSKTADQFNIRMFNMLGVQVYNNHIGQTQIGNVAIDVRHLPAGAYMLQVTDGDTQVTRKVIIE